jgi:hypothetical protein
MINNGITLGNTLDWARSLHFGIFDKSGAPYINHPIDVMNRLPAGVHDYERHTALLHDVMEDCYISETDLRSRGYDYENIQMIRWVSRLPEDNAKGLTYKKWIKLIADEAPLGAVRVKICDIEANSDPRRIWRTPVEFQGIVESRYLPSHQILRTALKSRFGIDWTNSNSVGPE